MKKWISRYATCRIAISGSAAEDLFGATWPANCTIVHSGRDLSSFAEQEDRDVVRRSMGLPSDALVLGHIGRFHPRKNHTMVIDVAAEVLRREPRAWQYNNGWCISVEPSGQIDNAYGYLFYESAQPNIWQNSEGWIISQTELSNFFNKNMQVYGFNSNEIHDFIEYWIPLLNTAKTYAVYPQMNYTIDRVIELEFSIKPKNVNRLFYVIKGVNEEFMLNEPEIVSFNKNGFYVNEWGVVL
jgi:hypothetical protein